MRTTSKAVEEPENADLRCEAGLILMEQGFWSEGADWIKTAIAIDPRHRAAHEGLAKFYDHLGDVEQAKQHRAVAEQPADSGAAASSKED
jgi:Tfp pilus assembly protein PilF